MTHISYFLQKSVDPPGDGWIDILGSDDLRVVTRHMAFVMRQDTGAEDIHLNFVGAKGWDKVKDKLHKYRIVERQDTDRSVEFIKSRYDQLSQLGRAKLRTEDETEEFMGLAKLIEHGWKTNY